MCERSDRRLAVHPSARPKQPSPAVVRCCVSRGHEDKGSDEQQQAPASTMMMRASATKRKRPRPAAPGQKRACLYTCPPLDRCFFFPFTRAQASNLGPGALYPSGGWGARLRSFVTIADNFLGSDPFRAKATLSHIHAAQKYAWYPSRPAAIPRSQELRVERFVDLGAGQRAVERLDDVYVWYVWLEEINLSSLSLSQDRSRGQSPCRCAQFEPTLLTWSEYLTRLKELVNSCGIGRRSVTTVARDGGRAPMMPWLCVDYVWTGWRRGCA